MENLIFIVTSTHQLTHNPPTKSGPKNMISLEETASNHIKMVSVVRQVYSREFWLDGWLHSLTNQDMDAFIELVKIGTPIHIEC